MDYLNWTWHSQKFFKLQRKIQETEKKNPRLCRNFQRLLYRTSKLQLFIIHQILQIQFKRSLSLVDKKSSAYGYFWSVPEPIFQETRTIQEKIIFPKLMSKEYQFFLTRQIMNILWVFALSPILENRKKDQIILTGLKSSQIYKIISTFFQKPFIQYIMISQFSNFFNKKNKFWILSNLLMEKKFFFHWLKREKVNVLSNTVQPWQFKYMSEEKTTDLGLLVKERPKGHRTGRRAQQTLSLKKTFENFTTLHFIYSYIPQVIQFNQQIQNSLALLDHRWNNGQKMGVRKFRNKVGIWQLNGKPEGRSADGFNRENFLIKISHFARPKSTAFGGTAPGAQAGEPGRRRPSGVLIKRNPSHWAGGARGRFLNFQKSLFIKFQEIYRQRAFPMDLSIVSLNIVRPFFDHFLTNKILQFNKFQTRLQKKYRNRPRHGARRAPAPKKERGLPFDRQANRRTTRSLTRSPEGPRFYSLAHRMFQFLKVQDPMRGISRRKPMGGGRPLCWALDSIPLNQRMEGRKKPEFYRLIIDIMRLFHEKYFYKKFHPFFLTFKFINDDYFIKFGLKQQSYFEISRHTAPSARRGRPPGAVPGLGAVHHRTPAGLLTKRAASLWLRFAFAKGKAKVGKAVLPTINKILFKFPFFNNGPPIWRRSWERAPSGSRACLGAKGPWSIPGFRNVFPNDWMEYSGFLLLPLTTKKNYQVIHQFCENYAQIHGLHLKLIKLFSLSQGIHFLGWFFQKKVNHWTGSISRANIQNHQKELKFYFQTPAHKNKPIDQVIYQLNQKILYWQKFYHCSIKLSKGQAARMNDYLFWRIWYWLKKRHRTRSSKWLYNRYWKKSTYRKWMFSDNHYTLIFYHL